MIFLARDERTQIARLFNFLMHGEYLAHDCAQKQAQFFSDAPSHKFFSSQAHQEHLHARIFKAGIGILKPRGIGEPLGKQPMEKYRYLLESALERGDEAESLLAMQVILEGLGDVSLNRISKGFPTRGLGFERVRKLVVGQEDAHHHFGLRRLNQCFETDADIPSSLKSRAEDYLELADQIMQSVAPLFDYFDEDIADYTCELKQNLPQWITGAEK